MRKGSTGLAYLVQYEMELEPFGKSVFLFCGRSGKTIKVYLVNNKRPNATQDPSRTKPYILTGLTGHTVIMPEPS